MKRTYLLGSVILGILILLAAMVGLTAAGAFGTDEMPVLVFASDSAEGAYNAEPLTASGWRLISGELKDGHTVKATAYGSQTEIGISENSMSVEIYDENNANVTEEYQIELKLGKIRVNPRTLRILTGSVTKQYDGNPLDCHSYQIVSGSLVKGHTLEVEYGIKRTEVGVSENTVVAKIMDGNTEVSSNYALDIINGKITVTGYPLTISTPSMEGVYNGLPLVYDSYELVSGELKDGDQLYVSVVGSQTEAGESANEIIVQILSLRGTDVTARYDIKKELGTLTVKPRDLYVVTGDKSAVYTGAAVENRQYTVEGSLVEGHTIYVSVTGKQVDVGVSDNTFIAEIKDKKGNIVTQNYNVSSSLGKLEVLPVDITITSSSAEKDYDTLPLTSSDYELTFGKLLPGHVIKVEITGEQKTVGIGDNTFIYCVTDADGNDVTRLYNIAEICGTLEIKPIEITIKTQGGEKMYDGSPLTVTGEDNWEISSGQLYTGHTIVAGLIGTQTNAGSSPNTLEYSIYDEKGTDVTSCYQVTEEFGELLVNPIKLTISTEGETRPYNGEELTKDSWTLVAGETLEGHSLEVDVYGVIKYAGEVQNDFICVIFDESGYDVTNNYEIERSLGTLKVLPIELTIFTGSDVKVYDGTPLMNTSWELVGGVVAEGHTFVAETIGTITNVGLVPNTISYNVYDENGDDITSTYHINESFGTLEVLPIQLTIKTESADKVYDGEELICHEYELVAGELLEGHRLDVQFSNSLTDVGEVYNTFLYQVFDENEIDVTSNYIATAIRGTLRVDPVRIIVYTDSGEKEYDGKPLTKTGWEIYEGKVLDGDTLHVTPYGTQTNVGVGFNHANWNVESSDGKNNSDNYSVQINPGPLEVTPIYLSVTSKGGTKMYDGTALRKEEYYITRGEVLENHSLAVMFNLFPIEAGTYENKMEVVIVNDEGIDVTRNYEVTRTYGKLEISRRTVTVRTASAQKPYDGTPLTANRYSIVSATKPLDGHEIFIVINGSQTDIGMSENVYAELRVVDSDGNDVTPNYDLTGAQLGLLKVTDPSLSSDTEEPPPPEEDDGTTLLAEVLSTSEGVIYLREMSFGNYTGRGFSSATPYNKTLDGLFGMSYLASSALAKENLISYEVHIRYETERYFLPQYIEQTYYDYTVQSNDVWFAANEDEAKAYYYSFEYTGLNQPWGVPSEYSTIEAEYSEFVKSNYRDVPSTTRAYLQRIIKEQDFSKDDPQIISKVAKYIQNVATYNLDFNREMEELEDDVVVAFLTKYKEGVCRHYAMAATLLLREIGIPARYTVGVVANIQAAGVWQEIYSSSAHAWTEVYIDGVGWLALEVTPGYTSDDGEEPEPPKPEPPEEPEDPEKPTIEIYPVTQRMEFYPGAVLYAKDEITGDKAFRDLLSLGYRYECVVNGSIDAIGYGESVIESFVLYDRLGVDVTDEYNIVFLKGTLHMYGEVLTISSHNLTTTYTGKPIKCEEYDSTGLLPNHILTVSFRGQGTDAGSYANGYVYEIRDKNGNDVSYMYLVNVFYGTIKIEQINITIEADSTTMTMAELEAMGGIYYAEKWEITSGALLEGHTIEVELDGYIDDLGRCDSSVASVTIRNENGTDITTSYNIVYVDGEMSVEP